MFLAFLILMLMLFVGLSLSIGVSLCSIICVIVTWLLFYIAVAHMHYTNIKYFEKLKCEGGCNNG